MSIESAADRLNLIKTLGELVVFSDGQDTWDVYGVLEREYADVGGVESYHPVLTCRETDTTRHATHSVDHGTTLQADSGSYTIVGLQPDGTGLVVFVLEEI